MAWLTILAAGLFETGFAVALKLSHGMTRTWPTVIFAVCALGDGVGDRGIDLQAGERGHVRRRPRHRLARHPTAF